MLLLIGLIEQVRVAFEGNFVPIFDDDIKCTKHIQCIIDSSLNIFKVKILMGVSEQDINF